MFNVTCNTQKCSYVQDARVRVLSAHIVKRVYVSTEPKATAVHIPHLSLSLLFRMLFWSAVTISICRSPQFDSICKRAFRIQMAIYICLPAESEGKMSNTTIFKRSTTERTLHIVQYTQPVHMRSPLNVCMCAIRI